MNAEQVEAVKLIAERMQHALLQARLYGGRHPITLVAANAMVEALDGPLEDLGALRFLTGPAGLSVRSAQITEESEEHDGVGRHLHREGIAELTLVAGLGADELGRLLDILRLNLSLPMYEEETLEHLMWAAEFDCIEFRAVKDLMEAEAISGDHQNFLAETHKQLMEDILERRDETRQLLAEALTDDGIHRAMAEHGLAGLAEEEIEVDDTPWARLLLDPTHPDYPELVSLCEEVQGERNADMMARVFLILCRAAMANRSELDTNEALQLADYVLDGLYESGVPFALMEASDGIEDLLDEHSTSNSPVIPRLRELSERSFEPMRIAKMLVELDPDTRYELREAQELVRRLPDQAFMAVVERANARDAEDSGWLQELLARASMHRVEDWLSDPKIQPERLVPTIGLLSHADSAKGRAMRRELVRHPTAPVRQAVLRWYARDLPPEDLEHVLHALTDRNHSVRREALGALKAQRVKGTSRWLKEQIGSKGFKRHPTDVRKGLAVALGEIAGDFGVDALAKLLEDGDHVDAAVAGLVAAGSKRAVAALKKGASSWTPNLRSACNSGLQRLGVR